jgi:hypothetical protein
MNNFNDQREKRMNLLRQQGHATVAQILWADFDVFPPRGVDPAIVPRQLVQFVPFAEYVKAHPEHQELVQYTQALIALSNDKSSDHKIYLNTELDYSPPDAIGHETIHKMQLDHYRLIAATRTFNGGADSLVREFLNAAKITQRARVRDPWQQTQAETCAHEDIAQTWDRKMGREIQARMHQCLVAGYGQWGRLPGTKEELWAVMIAVGVRAPSGFLAALQATEVGQKALHDFPPLPYTGAEGPLQAIASDVPEKLTRMYDGPRHRKGIVPGREIGSSQSYLRGKTEKIAFWQDILPAIYGDLLEMYGDGPGRARMGLGRNEKLTGSWLELLRDGDGIYGEKDFGHWAQTIGNERCAEALYNIIHSRWHQELPNDGKIVATLFAQPGIEEALHNWRGERGTTVLQEAILYAQPEIAIGLMDKGLSLHDRGSPGGQSVADWATDYINEAYAKAKGVHAHLASEDMRVINTLDFIFDSQSSLIMPEIPQKKTFAPEGHKSALTAEPI